MGTVEQAAPQARREEVRASRRNRRRDEAASRASRSVLADDLDAARPVGASWSLIWLVDRPDRRATSSTTTRPRSIFLRLLIVLALQMFSGNSGILSFGQVAFIAVGAYTSALLTIPTAIKQFTFLSMPHLLKDWVFPAQFERRSRGRSRAGVAALVVALVFGIPIVRLVGVAAGIATLAILVAMNVFIQQTSSITRGTSTQIGVPQTTTHARDAAVGDPRDRGRVRLQAVAQRPAAARLARERPGLALGRRARRARALHRVRALRLRVRHRRARSTATTSSRSATSTSTSTSRS